MYKLLLAEDEPKLGLLIKEELEKQKYKIDLAYDGQIAERLFKQNKYDLIILDINLPYKNGLILCKEFRAANTKIPIIMLTALGQIDDKVTAFEYGADDYMVKPFHFNELFARIKVFMKRSDAIVVSEKISFSDLEMDLEFKTVFRSGKEIQLTSKEFRLLELLVRAKGKVVSKQDILEKVWGISFETGTNTIEVYVNFIRNKIEKPFNKKNIIYKTWFWVFFKNF
jgi:two-component system copper resistance phosphate regulon response regulator CusR